MMRPRDACRRCRARVRPAGAPAGYVLLVVLLLASLMVASVAAYARHTLVDWRQSSNSLWCQETRESAQSGVAFARQVLASGNALGTTSVTAGDKTVAVIVTDKGGDLRGIRVDATSSSLGATVNADARVFNLPGSTLPVLTSAAMLAATTDPKLVTLAGTQTIQNTTYTGTVKLAKGAKITFDDVVVKGSIASEPSLAAPPYLPADATTLTVKNGLRIEPTLFAAVAIQMPDGQFTADATSSLEIHGSVVAQRITLLGVGAMDGQLAAGSPFTVPAGIDRPGFGRTPPPWPASLQLGTYGLKSLAFPRPAAPTADQVAIGQFTFPAK